MLNYASAGRYRVFGIDEDILIEHPAQTLDQAHLLQEEYSSLEYKARIWDGEQQCFLENRHEHRGRQERTAAHLSTTDAAVSGTFGTISTPQQRR